MGSKPKTRFYVCIAGRNIEVLSVRDRGRNGIVASSSFPRFFESVPGKFVGFVEQHYSVHPTKGSDTTVTQKTSLEDGTNISNVAYIHNTQGQLLWPIYARRIPKFDDRNRIMTERQKDNTICIGRFRYEKACFFYSVFITNKGEKHCLKGFSGVQIFRATFHLYDIIVVATYLNIPSLKEGDVAGFSTSPTVENGIISADHLQLYTGSMPADFLIPVHWKMMGVLRLRTLSRLKDIFKGDPLWGKVVEMTGTFTAEPIMQGD